MVDWLGLSIAVILQKPVFFPNLLAGIPMPPDQPSLEAKDDAIAFPPPRRVIASPEEAYFLTLQFLPQQRRSQAVLYEARGDRCQLVWQAALPHEYGPRFGLVNDQGHIALVDEWINVRSPRALTILDDTGSTVAQFAYADLRAAVGLSEAEILDRTQAGWWISDVPRLSGDGQRLIVGIGGQSIQANLSTGQLEPSLSAN
ncbi:hypothetical protein C7271_11775 [filamentous cyanobacterium CCP5]|nr:hypothetical protein C7271_11775 [filamentous cyanobacterium CCP5]